MYTTFTPKNRQIAQKLSRKLDPSTTQPLAK